METKEIINWILIAILALLLLYFISNQLCSVKTEIKKEPFRAPRAARKAAAPAPAPAAPAPAAPAPVPVAPAVPEVAPVVPAPAPAPMPVAIPVPVAPVAPAPMPAPVAPAPACPQCPICAEQKPCPVCAEQKPCPECKQVDCKCPECKCPAAEIKKKLEEIKKEKKPIDGKCPCFDKCPCCRRPRRQRKQLRKVCKRVCTYVDDVPELRFPGMLIEEKDDEQHPCFMRQPKRHFLERFEEEPEIKEGFTPFRYEPLDFDCLCGEKQVENFH